MRGLFFLLLSCRLLASQVLDQQVAAFAKRYQINGITVGLLPERTVASYGVISVHSLIPVNEDTLFRIGYLTQPFTAYVLAKLVLDGRCKLTDPISTFLGHNTVMPTFEGEPITLLNLATHTSGLPDAYFNPESFSANSMFKFLKDCQLPYAPGSKYQFSNLGYALLTNLLGRIAKQGYTNMVERMITQPQGLNDTTFALNNNQKNRFALGTAGNQEIKASDGDHLASVFIGSRGLYSTLNDLMTFTQSLMQDQPVARLMKNPYFHFPQFEVALGFTLSPSGVYSVESSLFGSSSLIYFNQKGAVIILANRSDVPLEELATLLLSK